MPDDLTFTFETIGDALRDGFEDLAALHWEEVALNKDTIPLVPDWDKYRYLERAGVLKSICARRAGKLIGYDVFFVQPAMHYSTSLWAVNDILYLDPEERRGLAGARLVRQSEKMLRDLGVQKVIYHTKLHVHLGHGKAHGTVGDLLIKLGYKHVENVLAKTL